MLRLIAWWSFRAMTLFVSNIISGLFEPRTLDSMYDVVMYSILVFSLVIIFTTRVS